jgi:branched-chain amino acid transport system substrate-binding protein
MDADILGEHDLMLRTIALAAAALTVLAACTSSSARGGKQGPLKLDVGVLYTTAGRGGDFASAALGAAKLAQQDAKRRFDVTLTVSEADYGGEVKRVPALVEKLRGKSDAVVVATDDPDVAVPLARFVDKPLVYALVTKDGVAEGDMTFRVGPTDRLQAQKIAEYLVRTRKYKRIAILSDTTQFGQDGARDLSAAFDEAGIEPTLNETFTPGGDIHTPAAAAGQENVDALILWTESPGEAARVVVEVHRIGFSYQLVLSPNVATATFAKNASAQVTPVAFRDGMLSVGTWAGPWFRVSRILGFYERFQTENADLAPREASTAYDAVLALAAAARRGGGTDAESIASGLEGLVDFEGAGVPLTFGPDKHEGVDLNDLGMLGFTKEQDSAGGDFQPDVDTGGGFFSIVSSSLNLPRKYRYLQAEV